MSKSRTDPKQFQSEATGRFSSLPHTRPEPFVDAQSAGNFLQLPRRRVLQLARQGKLPAYPIGKGVRKVWRFRLSDLAAAMLHSAQRSHVPEEKI
jgi:Helix-turn-helix domain